MKKLFNNYNITWKKLILFSILVGLVVGVLNRIPILYNTSFTDVAIYLEMWIILAIFIIMNCKNEKDAMIKCFVFFLISQPLIYFTEIIIDVLLKNGNFTILFTKYFRNYYIGNHWLLYTFLTIPGSFIAYQVKKDNVLSSIILAVATGFLGYRGVYQLFSIFNNNTFPNHILNALICLFMAFYLIILLLSRKKERIISIVITIIVSIIPIFVVINNNSIPILISYDLSIDNAKILECSIDDENIARADISYDNSYITIYTSGSIGTTNMRLITDDNKTYEYVINSTSKDFTVDELSN